VFFLTILMLCPGPCPADALGVLCRLETGVSKAHREDGGSVALPAHLVVQVHWESRGFKAREDQMAFRGSQAHQ